jgi:ABC-type sugar transport system ATPase subunit
VADLRLKGVKKSFGDVDVIPGIDLEIESGEFLVLVGPSGSGKSTLLRMIAGLEETTAGQIEVDGVDITHTDPSARDLAMVFQTYALYPHMTVEQNMSFALRMRKEDPKEIARRVREAVDILELNGLESRKPGQLSGGQRQRVAMGRCIVRKPKLFLFDEPLSNLDAKLRAQTRLEIRRLHERLKTTSVFVTHDQVEAMTMADRIALLRDGRLQQIGTARELYLHPKNRFVATFLGTPEMNLFGGTLVANESCLELDGPLALRLDAAEPTLARLKEAVRTGARVDVGVRPEHLETVTPGTAGALDLTVGVVEWLGHEAFVFCEAGDRQVALYVPAEMTKHPRPGERLAVRPAADRWHVFDADSGTNLLA